jgi:hypothetical protein
MDYLELLDELKQLDEVTLLEVLEITSDDIVEIFSDKINENLDRIYRMLRE